MSQISTEKDLKVLQRKHRALLVEHRRYTDEVEDQLRRQRKVIESLTTEHRELSRDLSLITAVPRDVEYRLSCERESGSREECRRLAEKCKEAETDRQRLESGILVLRKRLAGRGNGDRRDASEKYLQTLERRLNHSLVKFNELVGANSILRDEVDTLRQEKQHFLSIEKRFVSDIESTKRDCAAEVDRVNAYYAAKDKAVADLHHLRTMADREHFEFEREWKELNRLLDLDARVSQQVVRSDIATSMEVPQSVSIVESPKQDKEDLVSQSLAEASRYEQIFERIKQAVGTTSLAELVEFFSSKETQNFSLLNRSEFLASEINKLQAFTQDNEEEVSRLTAQAWDRRLVASSTLGRPVESSPLDERVRSLQGLVNRICLQIHAVTTHLDPTDEDVSAESVLSCLAIIDARVEDLLLAFRQQPATTTRRKSRRPRVNALALPSSITPLEDEESSRLLSRAEIAPTVATEKLARAQSANASTRPSTAAGGRKTLARPLAVLN